MKRIDWLMEAYEEHFRNSGKSYSYKFANGYLEDFEGEAEVPEKSAMETRALEIKSERSMAKVREIRNKLLEETDYLAVGDRLNAMTDDQKVYRQKLRDLPQDFPDVYIDEETEELMNVTWPKKPE